jgi:putative sigma-54 modulation protein
VPIQVFAHHMHLSDDTRQRVVEKAEHIRRIFDGILTVHVTLDAEKERRLVEVVTNVSHGAPVVARATTQNLNEAIELAFDKAEAQLRKHKDKIRDRRAREQGAVPPAEEATPEGEADAGEAPAAE